MKKIELVPDKQYSTHRINEDTIALYVSSDNINYTLIPKTNWEYQKDDKGVITLTLKERLATRYLKLHVKYDERGWDFKPVNKATFLNEVAQMLRVYQEADSRTEEYQYDMAGNRKLLRVTLARTLDYNSQYYTNTDRLKTDGKYAFVYDKAGNMVKKGNTFTISGDTVNFTETSGEGVEYWEYGYDLLNRLTKVSKNGSTVAEYGYDPEGFRVVAKKYLNDTTLKEKRHYIFQGTEPIFEKNITTGKVKSFVYALGKHLARVDGAIGDTEAKKYWYVTDHVGSIRAVTDKDGKKVWSADYLAFGKQFGEEGHEDYPDFEELHSFTGKEYDPDTGLHYYNARWYDADLGRFISEDPVGDPNNPNLYSYSGNNPLTRIDPTGESWDDVSSWISDTWNSICDTVSSWFGGGDSTNTTESSNSGQPSKEDSGGNTDTPPSPEPKTPEDGPTTKEGPNPNPGATVETPVAPPTLEEAKEAYKTAAEELEKARETKGTNPDAFREAQEKFNNALDDLIKAAGYDTSKYNHKTVVWEGITYIHVNSNPQVVLAVVELADKLGADKAVITEGDRTKKEHEDLYKDKPKDKQVKYENTEHGSAKGYMAADVQFYKDGTMVDKETAFSTAKTVTEIGGVGIYSFNSIHIDLRERVNGQPTTWDWR